MTWRYLTRSYVEALGLHHVPIVKWGGMTGCFIGPNETKPLVQDTISEGVHLGDALYERESDGLAYTRIER